MARKRATSWQISPTYGDETRGPVRVCDHPDCQTVAEHRAPKSRQEIRDYYWFCLDHVRAYNATWNYYSGMSQDEIEIELQKDTFWHRPTWPLGDRKSTRRQNGAGDPFGFFDDGPGDGIHDADTRDRREDEGYIQSAFSNGLRHTDALAVMDLRPPVTVVAIKARYKELVKRHHPDANGGSRRAEERLKVINVAYGTLIQALDC